MEPGLVKWKDFCVEFQSTVRIGWRREFSLENFQTDPDSGMRKEFWSGIGEWDPAW